VSGRIYRNKGRAQCAVLSSEHSPTHICRKRVGHEGAHSWTELPWYALTLRAKAIAEAKKKEKAR
jgi:hypothetical protein